MNHGGGDFEKKTFFASFFRITIQFLIFFMQVLLKCEHLKGREAHLKAQEVSFKTWKDNFRSKKVF